jgi:hypothetical protein
MTGAPPTPSIKGSIGGSFGAHKSPAVSKPAEYGPGDIPLKFYDESEALKGTPAKFNTPMDADLMGKPF